MPDNATKPDPHAMARLLALGLEEVSSTIRSIAGKGRPSDPRWKDKPPVPMSPETKEQLEWLSGEAGIGYTQLAARIIETALAKANLDVAKSAQGAQTTARPPSSYYTKLIPSIRHGFTPEKLVPALGCLSDEDWILILSDLGKSKELEVLAELMGWSDAGAGFISYLLDNAGIPRESIERLLRHEIGDTRARLATLQAIAGDPAAPEASNPGPSDTVPVSFGNLLVLPGDKDSWPDPAIFGASYAPIEVTTRAVIQHCESKTPRPAIIWLNHPDPMFLGGDETAVSTMVQKLLEDCEYTIATDKRNASRIRKAIQKYFAPQLRWKDYEGRPSYDSLKQRLSNDFPDWEDKPEVSIHSETGSPVWMQISVIILEGESDIYTERFHDSPSWIFELPAEGGLPREVVGFSIGIDDSYGLAMRRPQWDTERQLRILKKFHTLDLLRRITADDFFPDDDSPDQPKASSGKQKKSRKNSPRSQS